MERAKTIKITILFRSMRSIPYLNYNKITRSIISGKYFYHVTIILPTNTKHVYLNKSYGYDTGFCNEDAFTFGLDRGVKLEPQILPFLMSHFGSKKFLFLGFLGRYISIT